MNKSTEYLQDFEVDKLTNSLENRITKDSFPTEITFLTKNDLKTITKKNGWAFNWKAEFTLNDREVYKLTIVNNPTIIQGLVSLTIKPDHVFLNLLESAPFNIGQNKVYAGVPGNLVAFACKLSFGRGGDGFVSFQAKTKLIDHYVKTLGALHAGGHLMVIDALAAQKLIDKYFKS
ncbi:hypothetical protein AHMF7605_27045 [Adhaeribacter arboris]|uniref:Uncharacterized protein n=1 Tax=Adhaeribacter arboris TaxID=2072846 RepID=A0A2T2YPN9_9BACT|nr:hypothetical protein [Adhaeribacter arboris]PSR57471.1 hypothetical protein AHMF7605_27045 [Adhaeribacter arboris]